MDYLTHAWIAMRAIKMLEDEEQSNDLVAILKAHAPDVLPGAWLPDQTSDAIRANAASECHILKFTEFPMDNVLKDRFIVKKNEFLNGLGDQRKMPGYIRAASVLDDEWWSKAYKGDVDQPGQHVVNRAQAFSMTMLDLLVLGNKEMCDHMSRAAIAAAYVDPTAFTAEAQAVFHFFILSHLVADSCMPCHCDARPLSTSGNKLHEKIEEHWSSVVRKTYSGKCKVPPRDKPTAAEIRAFGDCVAANVTDVDTAFGIQFAQQPQVPSLGKNNDVWLELMQVCRASFAIASIIVDYRQFKYKDTGLTLFKDVFADEAKWDEFSRTILHDAVLNVAMVWKHIWQRVN